MTIRYFHVAYQYENAVDRGVASAQVTTTKGKYLNLKAFEEWARAEQMANKYDHDVKVVVTNIIELSEQDYTEFLEGA